MTVRLGKGGRLIRTDQDYAVAPQEMAVSMDNTVLVLGSVAFDYIMKYEGRFRDVIVADAYQNYVASMNVSNLRIRFGGTAANISYNLGLLGVKAIVVSAVGKDISNMKYDEHLQKAGVDLRLTVMPNEHTAAAYIISDITNNQFTAFHPGALRYASKVSIERTVRDAIDRVKLAILAPNPVDAFINHSKELTKLGIPFIFDPGQATPAFTSEQLLEIIPSSMLLVANTHEFEMVRKKLEATTEQLLEMVPNIIVTEGGNGSNLYGKENIRHIPIAKPRVFRDPTGAGDGYRAGLLAGLLNSLTIEDSAKLGAVVGSFVVEGEGPQEHTFTLNEVRQRYKATFGQAVRMI